MALDYAIYGQGHTDVTYKVTVEASSHVASYTAVYRHVDVAQIYPTT